MRRVSRREVDTSATTNSAPALFSSPMRSRAVSTGVSSESPRASVAAIVNTPTCRSPTSSDAEAGTLGPVAGGAAVGSVPLGSVGSVPAGLAAIKGRAAWPDAAR